MSEDKYNRQGPVNKPIAVTDDEFDQLVLKSDLPVVVDFWAPWCGPCKTISPSLETLAGEFAGRVIVAKVNSDKNKRWAQKLGVRGIPHLLYMHKGQVIDRSVGASPRAKLQLAFESFLTKVGPQAETACEKHVAEFEAAVAAAEAQKERRTADASTTFQTKAKAEFDEADASRAAFDAIVDTEMAAEKARVAAGTLAQDEYEKLWRTASLRLWDDARYSTQRQRQERAITALNSGQCEVWKNEFFAENEAAEQEYNQTVDAARARLDASRCAPKQK